uniref:Uncharacterized protein n=1 Tax=Anguilla anguilla TaxID=7936 RepID=A0A0E9S462_ANGAN
MKLTGTVFLVFRYTNMSTAIRKSFGCLQTSV